MRECSPTCPDSSWAATESPTSINTSRKDIWNIWRPLGKGLQINVGKFVTPAGAEVIETKDNWNYSRGLLFALAIPYFHFGTSAKYAFNRNLR